MPELRSIAALRRSQFQNGLGWVGSGRAGSGSHPGGALLVTLEMSDPVKPSMQPGRDLIWPATGVRIGHFAIGYIMP